MEYRPASLQDCAAITHLVIRATTGDGFHDYFFPREKEYPNDHYNWWYRRIRNLLLAPYMMVLAGMEESGKIVGMAAWKVSGLEPGEHWDLVGLDLEKSSYTEVAQRYAFAAHDKVADYMHPNQAVSPEHMQEWSGVVQQMKEEYWSGDERVIWYLVDLSVDPLWEADETAKEQLRGMVIRWGLEQAERDGLPAAVGAIDGQEALYERYGFEREPKRWVVGEQEDSPACRLLKRPLKAVE